MQPDRILVVDDEVDMKSMYESHFRKEIRQERYRFLFGQDGEEALNLLKTHPDICLVLADINMPKMDGLTLLSAIHRASYIDQPYQYVKVIMVTAYGDMENIRKALNAGAFDFLTKPIDFGDLERTIAKSLRETKKLRELHARYEAEQQRRIQAERQLSELNSILKNSGLGGMPV